MARGGIIVGVLVALLLATASPARAGWTPAQELSTGTLAAWAAPKVAVGLDGTAVVAWREGCCAAEVLMAAVRPPGGTFGPAMRVSPAEDLQAYPPAVAVTATGEVVIAWARRHEDPDRTGLAVASAPPGEGFGPPRMIAPANGDRVTLHADAAGGLHVAYGADSLEPRFLHRPPGGDWEAQAFPGTGGGSFTRSAVAFSGDGSALFAWEQGGVGLRARLRSGPRGSWGDAVTVEAVREAGNGPSVPVAVGGPGGRLALHWLSRVSDAETIVRLAQATGSGGFGAPQVLTPSTTGLGVAFGPSGDALMACHCFNGPESGLGVRESTAGAWSAMQRATGSVATDLGGDQGPKVAFDAGGAVHVAWNGYTTALRQSAAVVSSRLPGQAWTGPVAASPTHGWIIGRDIAAGRAGDVVVAWTYTSPRRSAIQVAQWTDAPPSPPPPPPPLPAQPSAEHTGLFQGTPSRNGRLKGTGLKAPLEPAWRVQTGRFAGWVPAGDGRVFTSAVRSDGVHVVALDVATGAELWSTLVSGHTWDFPTLALLGDGVYAGSFGRLTMLDAATGAERWATGAVGDSSGMPVLAGGEILAAWWGLGASLMAFDPATGARRTAIGMGNAAGPVVTGRGLAFFGGPCSPLAVDLAARKKVWQPGSACRFDRGEPMAFDGDWLWAGAVPEGRVHRWEDGDALRAIEGGMPAFAEPYGYRAVGERMVAFDPRTLETAWSSPLPGPPATAPLVADDLVLVASHDGEITAFDRSTGALRWSGHAGERIWEELGTLFGLGVADGHLIVPTRHGLTAFRVAAAAPGEEPEPAPAEPPAGPPAPAEPPAPAAPSAPAAPAAPAPGPPRRPAARPVVLRTPVLDRRRRRVIVRMDCRVPCRGTLTAGRARTTFRPAVGRRTVTLRLPRAARKGARLRVVVGVTTPTGDALRRRAWRLRAR